MAEQPRPLRRTSFSYFLSCQDEGAERREASVGSGCDLGSEAPCVAAGKASVLANRGQVRAPCPRLWEK